MLSDLLPKDTRNIAAIRQLIEGSQYFPQIRAKFPVADQKYFAGVLTGIFLNRECGGLAFSAEIDVQAIQGRLDEFLEALGQTDTQDEEMRKILSALPLVETAMEEIEQKEEEEEKRKIQDDIQISNSGCSSGKTWNSMAGEPEVSTSLDWLPAEVSRNNDFPEPLSYDSQTKRLRYRGQMSRSSYDWLRNLSQSSGYRRAIDELSRLSSGSARRRWFARFLPWHW
jgi:hypothetical protein